ncbi:MAG: RHS repeat-associated core domain-containing protein, partial [Alphaproteobacteria bacterium]|nr:RHS repeat-associated core domain-containing protein [Alphaproteobacteria bacterium]
YDTLRVPYNGTNNDNYVNGAGFCCTTNTATGIPTSGGGGTGGAGNITGGNDNPEIYQYFYHSDHLGSSSFITNLDGEVAQHIEYVPFGEVFLEERDTTWNTPYKFNGKELDEETGLSYYGARYYDPRASLWISSDPMREKYPGVSSYAYCANNPVKLIDPDGRYTKVSQNSDGTYTVQGGELDKDRNIYIYTQDKNGEYTIRGKSIGKSKLITSFYYSEKETWALGSIIKPNDNSGKNFFASFNKEEPSITDYMEKAIGGGKYDFKRSGATKGDANYDNPTYHYRGMPVEVDKDGTIVYSSARDIGNYTAGYIVGIMVLRWDWARKKFDELESKQQGHPAVEGFSTQNAEYQGWNEGFNKANNTPLKSGRWFTKSIPGGIWYFLKKL